jgi:hypothetical protein
LYRDSYKVVYDEVEADIWWVKDGGHSAIATSTSKIASVDNETE